MLGEYFDRLLYQGGPKSSICFSTYTESKLPLIGEIQESYGTASKGATIGPRDLAYILDGNIFKRG